jgi:hypothetical protein
VDTVRRVRVILDVKRTQFRRLIDRGQDVCHGFSTHPDLFLAPDPQVPVLQDYVQDLVEAQRVVRTRAAGAAEDRNVKAGILAHGLLTAQLYVQGLINAAPPDQGPLIARAAGMVVAQSTAYTKPLLKVVQEIPSGPVLLVVNVGLLTAEVKGKVVFDWQLSGDSGRTWVRLPPTPHGHTEVAGLTPLQTYAFRVGVISGDGPGPWSEPVTFLVR